MVGRLGDIGGVSLDAAALKKRLLSGSAWAIGGKAGAAVAGVATNALLARMLAPAELGAYFLALSVVSLGAIVGCLGLNRAAVRFVAESLGLDRPRRARRAVRLATALGGLGAVGSAVAYLLLGPLVAGSLFGSPALVAVTGLVAGWIAVSTVQELFAESFRGLHDVRLATLFGGVATGGNSAGLLMRAMMLAALGYLCWTADAIDLWTVMLVMVGTGIVSALVSAWVLRLKVRALGDNASTGGDSLAVGEMLRVSAPVLVTNLTVFFLLQSDIWILAAFRGGEEVAIYGAASRFVALVTMPLMVVNAVLPPVIAGLYARGETDRLEGTMRPVATIAGIPSLLALAVLLLAGGPILGLVYGEFYAAGAVVLALLSLGKLAAVWSGSCGLALQMTGNQNLMMWISIASGLLFVSGALWVVQGYGGTGIAAVAAASVVFQNAAMVLAARWKAGIWTHVTVPTGLLRRLIGRNR